MTRHRRPSYDGPSPIRPLPVHRVVGLWEVSLRASWDYPFIELSRAVPDTPISMWCVWNRELLQIPSRDAQVLREVERAVRKAGQIVDRWTDAHATRLFLLRCTCEKYRSPWNIIDDNECWDAPPIVYEDGWANFRVISFDEANPRSLYRDLKRWGRAELLRKRELPLSVLPTSIYANALFGELTAKQSAALLAAARSGYYTSPRQVTTESIASAVGISRTTYEEHLRKAENRVIAALIPYLQLFAAADHPAERLPLAAAPVGHVEDGSTT
jgi:predicted DNA binding protein